MTQNPTETQFSVRISGITYEDAVTATAKKMASLRSLSDTLTT
jgi:hypothetical protein